MNGGGEIVDEYIMEIVYRPCFCGRPVEGSQAVTGRSRRYTIVAISRVGSRRDSQIKRQ